MLKCSKCNTIDQTKFNSCRINRNRSGKKIVYLDWCNECLRHNDHNRREKNKLNEDLTRIIKCPKCSKEGDFSSGLFMKSRYLFSKESCICSKCRRSNIKYKIRKNQSKRIRECIQDYKKFKTRHGLTMKLIGCSPQELIEHLEKGFKPKMTWDNYGTYWHIDHILPIASFDLTKEENINKCFHFSNLQPLTAEENLKKGDKIS